MMGVRIIDLDGSLRPQADVFAGAAPDWIPAEEWGPRIRLACNFGVFGRFRKWLDQARPAPEPAVTFYGSGDFHHVSLALLGRIREPFHLLVLDKHPDWMRGIPFLHCGTWLRHALRLPNLRRAFHCGGETDFDNAYRWLAPWPEIAAKRVVVFPACRPFACGRWRRIEVEPLLSEGCTPADMLAAALRPFRDELRRYPLYISLDKDVLTDRDAAVNWDSGLLKLEQAVSILETFLMAAEGRLVGADVLGDWSPMRMGQWLNRLSAHIDHPKLAIDPVDAARRNSTANAVLLRAIVGDGVHR